MVRWGGLPAGGPGAEHGLGVRVHGMSRWSSARMSRPKVEGGTTEMQKHALLLTRTPNGYSQNTKLLQYLREGFVRGKVSKQEYTTEHLASLRSVCLHAL